MQSWQRTTGTLRATREKSKEVREQRRVTQGSELVGAQIEVARLVSLSAVTSRAVHTRTMLHPAGM